jgi:L-asparaginase II
MDPLIVEYTRGSVPESHHYVHAVWVDDRGRTVKSWGSEDRLVCPRSSLKPLQAIPMALSRAFEKSPDPMKALAIAFASHKAEDMHVEFVRAWLPMLGREENDLVCGVQYPEDFERVRDVLQKKMTVGRAFNNCSGKHTGMLATCQAMGLPHHNYHLWAHPLQRRIREIATELSDLDWEKAPYGIDGCGLPNYHIPMNAFARALSRFLRPELSPYGEAMELIREAWAREPYMVAGHGDVSSELTRMTKGRIVAKIGAQGNFMAFDYHQGRCLVLKVDDGAARAAEESLVALLFAAGSITTEEEHELRKYVPRDIYNWAGEPVGQVHTRL